MIRIIWIFYFLLIIFLTIVARGEKIWKESGQCEPDEITIHTSVPISPFMAENDNEPNYLFDFEDQQLTEWISTNDWLISSEGKINGNFSLRHSPKTTSSESVIFYPVNLKLDADYRWDVTLKNGNWDPSSSNRFWYYLLADSANPSALNGWAVGVNITGSSDILELWRFKNGKPDSLIVQSNLVWKTNTQFRIEVEQKGKGQWSLCSLNTSSNQSETAKGTDFATFDFNFIGLHFDYTSTRAGQLWADDIAVTGLPVPPFIEKITVLNEERLELIFNKEIDPASVKNQNFKLVSSSGKPLNIVNSNAPAPEKIELTVERPSEFDLNLIVSGISDLAGLQMETDTLAFCWVLPCHEHSLVINEIFADPNPAQGLPEYEYLELFNRTDFPVSLSNLTLKVNEKECPFDTAPLYPGKYLLLTNTEGAAFFENSIGLKNFPTLLNNGAKISIETPDGLLIDEISYTDSWYADDDKKNGGWSLERIDPNRFCNQSGNWTASVAPTGGSPGGKNSVAADNQDTEKPEITGLEVVSANRIKLLFSENIVPESLENIINYLVSPSIGHPLRVETNGAAEAILIFSENFVSNTNYSLQVSGLTDECGNTMENKEHNFGLQQLAKGDVLISEVLFNPYPGGADFVEIYNHSEKTVNLKNLRLANRDDQSKLKDVCKLCDNDYWVQPGGYVLCTGDSSSVHLFYYTSCPDCFFETASLPSFPDDRGTVVLLNDSLQVLDEFQYSEKMHHPLLDDCEGISLERLSFESATASAANWHSAASSVGFATPGYANSQQREELQTKENIVLSPEVFSPNNDGYNDRLLIHYQLEKPGYSGNVKIYDSQGRLVSHLVKNEIMGQEGDWYWDGEKADNTRPGLGIYIVLVELFDMNGNVKKYRKTCTLTDRL